MEVKFKDLSIPLKIVVIFAWIVMGFYAAFFVAGLVAGILGL
jgi:hypothetical protein